MEGKKIIKISEINRALEINRELANNGYLGGGRDANWGTYYSPLDGQIKEGVFPISATFSRTLPEKYQSKSENDPVMKKYIEETLSMGEEKHPLTAVEFGGPGSNVFEGFTKNFFETTTGVCLEDIRSNDKKDEDKANHHFVVSGDALDPSYIEDNQTLKKVLKTLGTGGVDLIICRMDGPLNHIVKNGAILDRIIRNWYEILNYNGFMFIQFDRGGFDPDTVTIEAVEKWANELKKRFPEIDIQLNEGAMRLHKKDGSPQYLPSTTKLFSRAD